MKHLIFTLCIFLSGLSISAQNIHYEFFDTIRYKDGSFTSPNTVLNDIDDNGNMVGYFQDDDGYNAGLLVLANGKMSSFEFFGYNNTEITGINDAGYVVGKAYNASNASIVFQASIVGEIIDQAVELVWNNPTGMSKNVGKLNDDNVATGNARISTQNWLHFESIVAPFTVDNSKRYSTNNPSFVTYNTYGLGLNNFEKYTGWFQDGVNRTPYIYDGISDAFFPQQHYPTGAVQLRTYLNDINDAGYMAITYRDVNNTFHGEVAYYDGASVNYANNFPLSNTDHLELFGINNNNDVVGYYENGNGEKIGLYAIAEGPGLKLFDPNLHGFSFDNSNQVFEYPTNFFNYIEMDPYQMISDSFYAHRILPFFELDAGQTNSILTGSRNASWLAFVLSRDESLSYITQNDGTKIPREDAINKWLEITSNDFNGNCFGMSVFALQNLADPNILPYRFGNYITPQQNMIDYDASTIEFREVIATLQVHSYGSQLNDVTVNYQALSTAYDNANWVNLNDLMGASIREVLHGLKQDDPDSTHILAFEVLGSKRFHHAVLPFKVTRTMDLSVSGDTIHCVDPSYPGDVLKVYVDYNSGYNKGYMNDTVLYDLAFVHHYGYLSEIAPVNPVTFQDESLEGNPKSLLPPFTSMLVSNLCDFSIENMDLPSETFSIQQGDFSSSWPSIGAYLQMDADDKVDRLMAPGILHTKTSINACGNRTNFSYNYQDGTMIFSRENALPGEVDIVENNGGEISITNPDNVEKELNIVAIHSSANTETLIGVNEYTIGQNEIINLETIDSTHFLLSNGENDDKDYNLIVHYVDGDNLIDVSFTTINIDVETNHLIVIQPEVEDAQVIILVDENQDGSIEDTLFGMTQPPVSVSDVPQLSQFNVYPNPAEDLLNFTLAYDRQVILSAGLFDIFGREVLTKKLFSIHQNEFNLNVSDLNPGMYLLNIRDENGNTVGTKRVYIK